MRAAAKFVPFSPMVIARMWQTFPGSVGDVAEAIRRKSSRRKADASLSLYCGSTAGGCRIARRGGAGRNGHEVEWGALNHEDPHL